MEKENLIKKLQSKDINPADIIDIHVHLPLLNEQNTEQVVENPHALIPADIVKETFGIVEPEIFIENYNSIIGGIGLLPVEGHNLYGESSPMFSPNSRVLDLAKKFPDFIIPFASVNMKEKDSPDRIRELFDRGIAGIKYHALEGYSLSDCDHALEAIAGLNLPLIVHLGDTPFPHVDLNDAHPGILIPIANKFPNLRMLITHFATPLHNEAFWIASRYENIYMDVAEYPVYWSPHPLNPYGPLLSPLNTKRVGVHKFVFGTDFPMPTLKLDNGTVKAYVHDIAYYLESFLDLPDNFFSDKEKNLILTKNVWDFLGRTREEICNRNRSKLD